MEKSHSDQPRTGRFPIIPGSESIFTEINEYIYFSLIQPVPWKVRLEMVIGMQIKILNRIMTLLFYGSFQIFKWKET